MKKKNPQLEVDYFNSICKIGDQVTVQLDGGTSRVTATTGAACVMGGHTAVIWLEGFSGCYLLSRVTPVREQSLQ